MSSHKSRAEMFPPHWPDSDELAATLAKLSLNTKSKTITEDKSQPPTPDNTGSPANFQIIAPGLYRSSYPHHVHFERLAASLFVQRLHSEISISIPCLAISLKPASILQTIADGASSATTTPASVWCSQTALVSPMAPFKREAAVVC